MTAKLARAIDAVFDAALRKAMNDRFEDVKLTERLRNAQLIPVKDEPGVFVVHDAPVIAIPPRAGKMAFLRAAREREQTFGANLGNEFMSAMRDELYRRQYREERSLAEHEQPVIGGEG